MRMRTSHVLVAAFLAAGIASTAEAQSGPATRAACNLSHASGVVQERLVSGQRQRAYRLFVPPGYDGRTRLPLVLDLHGSGGTAEGQAKNSGFEVVAARERFAVATLEADSARWNVPVAKERPDDVEKRWRQLDVSEPNALRAVAVSSRRQPIKLPFASP